MMLFMLASRLRSGIPDRRGAELWQRQPRRRRFLRNLLDLSVRPTTKLDFAARCILLIAFALLCHGFGAGAALFVKAAPLSAVVVFGALFLFAATNWVSRD